MHWPGSDLAIPVLVGRLRPGGLGAGHRRRAECAAGTPLELGRAGDRRPAADGRGGRGLTGVNGLDMVKRFVVAFGRFWWDFLIGDTPELFVGAVAVVGLVALLCLDHGLRTRAALILPLLVVGLLGAVGVAGGPGAAILSPRQPVTRQSAAQSRKLLNCRGMPKSSALQAAITSWRSSRFLPVTRSWSPWVCELTRP